VLQDVDQLSERIVHEEPAHAPWLVRRAVFDGDARFPASRERLLDIVYSIAVA
jgi:hypothetical protein